MYFAFFYYLCHRMAQRKHQIISFLLLLVIGFYLGGSTLFVHSHNIDGIKIVHSHPLAGSSHTHTSSQLQTISFLATFLALVATSTVALSQIEGFQSEIIAKPCKRIISVATLAHSLRAPPASVL